MPSDLPLLHQTTVIESEIDSLGHLNVRYYLERMDRANRMLLEQLGVQAGATSVLRRCDTYSRFRREQFLGATLDTYAGVLAVSESGMRSYAEIRNTDTDEVAACFVTMTQLIDPTTQNAKPFPLAAAQSAQQSVVDIPRHGAPRSLSLGPLRTDITVEMLEDIVPEEAAAAGMMSGRRSATVRPEDTDALGWLADSIDVMFLPFITQINSDNPPGPPVFNTADGKRVGWAMMETRNLNYGRPRTGDTVLYFGADIAFTEKSRHSRRWAFDQASGRLLGISDSVGVCIDLDARKAIEMPAEVRVAIEQHNAPHLA